MTDIPNFRDRAFVDRGVPSFFCSREETAFDSNHAIKSFIFHFFVSFRNFREKKIEMERESMRFLVSKIAKWDTVLVSKGAQPNSMLFVVELNPCELWKLFVAPASLKQNLFFDRENFDRLSFLSFSVLFLAFESSMACQIFLSLLQPTSKGDFIVKMGKVLSLLAFLRK